jgi:cytochrome c-type biogenesis protein CcmH
MKRRCLLALFLFHTLIAVSGPSLAVEPSEVLADPALETRARSLSQHLRCVVCQNQSIDDSNAPLARDLRLIVRERLSAGDTDSAALDYIVARYGNFVLLKPPVQINTLLLWFGPCIIFALALLAYWTLVRRRPQPGAGEAAASLTAAEREQLQSILKESPTT